jgi:multimeric flavodoxin WrbA
MTCRGETDAVLHVNIQNIDEGDIYDGFIFGSPVYYSV